MYSDLDLRRSLQGRAEFHESISQRVNGGLRTFPRCLVPGTNGCLSGLSPRSKGVGVWLLCGQCVLVKAGPVQSYLLLELLCRVVVDQGHREGDDIVVPDQCQQHSRVSGRPNPSHNVYFPGGFCADIQRRSGCNESGSSQGNSSGTEMRVSSTPDRSTGTTDSSAHSGRGPPGKKASGEHTTRLYPKTCQCLNMSVEWYSTRATEGDDLFVPHQC